jgi:hypothetical protein
MIRNMGEQYCNISSTVFIASCSVGAVEPFFMVSGIGEVGVIYEIETLHNHSVSDISETEATSNPSAVNKYQL